MIPQGLADVLGILLVILASMGYAAIGFKADNDQFVYAAWASILTLTILAGFKLLFWM